MKKESFVLSGLKDEDLLGSPAAARWAAVPPRAVKQLQQFVVSFNGPDNIGKTTHIRLLKNAHVFSCAESGGVHLYDDGWPRLSHGDLRAWRLLECPINDFVDLVFRSYLNRSVAIAKLGEIVLLDRGLNMLEAACLATAYIRDRERLPSVRERIALLKQRLTTCLEHRRVILIYSQDIEESVDYCLHKEPFVTPLYREYQVRLHKMLYRQIENREYDAVFCCQGKGICEIHAELKIWFGQQLR